ncbi:ABC transporter family substrate-binding protein [Aquipuribacter sp. SD81]|uniref:ABC transporter family substrate-binding protein n=1 Tax=Aquipuribacter sp. SD81 TaxID=3127703 RepID=UPI0030166561
MISTRTSAKVIALLAGSALVLSACATSDDGAAEGEATAGGGDAATAEPTDTGASAGEAAGSGTFTWAYEQEIFSYNSDTAETNASANAVALNPVLRGFWYFGPEGTVEPDEEFGTFEVTSEDPLTIDYTFAEEAVWSDGEPIDCDDAVLYWAAQNGGFPEFSAAGNTGYESHARPDCEDGDKSFTVTYDTPYADYAATYGAMKPAHVLERESGVEDIIAAVDAGDAEALSPAAEFWNTGWNFAPGEWNSETALSSGPYVVDSWEAGQSLTYTANPEWWGTPPASDTIVTRFIAQDAQAQALQNGEIQAMAPQPSPDLLAQLEAIGDSIEVAGQDQYTYEHWDFNFQGEFADPVLREAFALCIPRQTMIDNLIAPLNPEAEVLNARFSFPFEPDYEAIVGAAYDGQSEQDIEAAAALLEENGLTGTTLRLGHNANPRRQQEAALIVDACGPNGAGFDVQDIGNENFFEADGELATGAFDVAQFAWAGSPLKSGSVSTFECVPEGEPKGNNNGYYCNEEVDALLDQLVQEPDADAQTELVTQIETILWEDLATIPGFTFPGLLATTSGVEGVVYNPTQADLTWNAWEWANTAQ